MEKLKQETVNFTEKNIEKIAALFPSAITESKDHNGNLKRAINFEQLKQLLSHEVADGDECYEFTWVGKKQSIIEGNRPIRKTLRPCKEESKNWDSTENLYIEGDNLDVLKLLQNSYLNKVKMIYIDPPYNTGNDFVYRDNFKVSKEDYEEELGLFDEEENRLFKNTESNGRFHSDWCSMMYPRLQLARNLLTDDGVIFISIDDNENKNLKNLCEEIFGDTNFVGQLVIQTATDNNPTQINTEHEYMLVYGKNKKSLPYWSSKSDAAEKIQTQYELLKRKYHNDYDKIQDELRTWIKKERDNLPRVTHYDNVDEKGVFHDGDIANTKFGGYKYQVFHPITKKVCKIPAKGFRFPESTLLQMIESNDIMFGDDENTLIKPKKRLSDARDILRTIIYEDGRTSSKEVDSLIGRSVFNNPKSHNILKRIFSFTVDKSDIILDFFSGSSSTAHAVMQLNAEDGGNRKFIMVQLPEETDPKSEAYKAGYKNICEIGKERIRRAGKKIEEELKAKSKEVDLFDEKESKTLDTGFRVLKVDSTNMKDVYYSPSEYNQQLLLELESNIKEDRSDIDLLYGVLLDWGVPLSLPHITEKIGGKDVHFVNETDLVACFEENIPEEVIREIAKRKPLRVVFRDSSFRSSPDKINVTEIFKILSPETTIKVI